MSPVIDLLILYSFRSTYRGMQEETHVISVIYAANCLQEHAFQRHAPLHLIQLVIIFSYRN